MKLNENVIAFRKPLKVVYLYSILVIFLESDFLARVEEQVPAINDHWKAFYDFWKAYDQKHTVKKLQTLCIQKTREAMRSLTDESFQSLQVPLPVRKLLMLCDVTDVLCEAFHMWPERMPIEDDVILNSVKENWLALR